MNTCKHCKLPIPTFIVVDGKHKKTAWGRQACYLCRPFGCFDNRSPDVRTGVVDSQKQCGHCKEWKPIEAFNFNHSRRGHQTNCKECAAKIKREGRTNIKRKCVIYKGGKCQICGYDKALASLCFHHLNPAEKSFAIALPFKRKWEELKAELDKCILLCTNCHGEIHEGIVKLSVK